MITAHRFLQNLTVPWVRNRSTDKVSKWDGLTDGRTAEYWAIIGQTWARRYLLVSAGASRTLARALAMRLSVRLPVSVSQVAALTTYDWWCPREDLMKYQRNSSSSRRTPTTIRAKKRSHDDDDDEPTFNEETW